MLTHIERNFLNVVVTIGSFCVIFSLFFSVARIETLTLCLYGCQSVG